MTKKALKRIGSKEEIKTISVLIYIQIMSGDELPFIDIRKKMQIRGAK